MTVRLLEGDARDVLRGLPAESVHCVVTSPPYWGLRDYGVAGQIGLEPDFRAYIETLVAVFRSVRRVLRADGTLWLNLGDSYSSRPSGIIGKESRLKGAFTGHDSYRNALVARAKRSPALKHKDLMLMPARVAIALQEDGWWLRQDIIWSKPNPMPESVTDRCTKAHEYLFLLSKSQRYHYDAAAIREESLTGDPRRPYGSPGGGALDGREMPQGNGEPRKIKVPGGWDRGEGAHGTIHRDGRTSAEYQEAVVAAGRNKRSVWTIATTPYAEAHFATFPPAVVEPCIKAGCPVGGTVLDPFGGAGTTGLVADRLGRDAILIELNPAYAEMARRRIADDAGLFAEVAAE